MNYRNLAGVLAAVAVSLGGSGCLLARSLNAQPGALHETQSGPEAEAEAEPSRESDATTQLCSAYCYYHTKKHGIARKRLTAANDTAALAWDQLTRECRELEETRGKPELQKSLSTRENPGDDFIAATPENSCAAYVKSADSGG